MFVKWLTLEFVKMSDKSMGESEEMDRDLKEYLACFKSNEGKQPRPKAASPVKEKVHKKYEKVVEDPSSQKLNSSKENSLSEDSSLFSTSSPHKRFNLQDVSDLQTSHVISESDVTPPSAKQGDDNSVSAIGKLVLSLKELGGTPEDTALNNNSDNDDVTTSSFYINANVFTVDDLVAADDIESATSKSTAAADDDDDKITYNKSTGLDEGEVKSYKDDFEENTFVEESFVSESIKEDVSSSNTTEIRPSESDGGVELTSIAVPSSPDVDKDTSISQTEETQTFQHSNTSQSTNTSTESSLSKHEVCTVNVDPYC